MISAANVNIDSYLSSATSQITLLRQLPNECRGRDYMAANLKLRESGFELVKSKLSTEFKNKISDIQNSV